MKIGIIGAMDVEVVRLKKTMTAPHETRISGIPIVCGSISGHDVIVARCGIGKVFAAMCAQTLCLHFAPDCIINTGVAGTLSPELHITDVAVGTSVVQYDVDTTAFGDPVGMISGLNQVFFPADARLAAAAEQALQSLGVPYRAGVIASADRFLADPAKKAELHQSFGAIACEMEGGAVGQVCAVNHVPFLILRAISDGANGDAEMDYPAFLQAAAMRSSDVLLAMIDRIAAGNS